MARFKKEKNYLLKQKFNRRKKTIKSLKILLVFIFFITSVWFLIQLKDIKKFKVDKVFWNIENSCNIELNQKIASELKLTIKPFLDINYFELDLNQIREELAKNPWVAEVKIKRLFWNDISINVKFHKILLRYNNDGYISDRGVLFKPNIYIDTNAVLAVGVDEKYKDVFNNYLNYQKILMPIGEIIKVIDERDVTELTLDSNIILKLGYQLQIERLKRFIKIYKQTKFKEYSVVDMRYAKGFVVVD